MEQKAGATRNAKRPERHVGIKAISTDASLCSYQHLITRQKCSQKKEAEFEQKDSIVDENIVYICLH